MGNRLHLAFRRQVSEHNAELYATKNNMAFFEVSPLCNYNIRESCAEVILIWKITIYLITKMIGLYWIIHSYQEWLYSVMEWKSCGKIILVFKHYTILLLVMKSNFLKKQFCSLISTRIMLSSDCRPNLSVQHRAAAAPSATQIMSQIILIID